MTTRFLRPLSYWPNFPFDTESKVKVISKFWQYAQLTEKKLLNTKAFPLNQNLSKCYGISFENVLKILKLLNFRSAAIKPKIFWISREENQKKDSRHFRNLYTPCTVALFSGNSSLVLTIINSFWNEDKRFSENETVSGPTEMQSTKWRMWC